MIERKIEEGEASFIFQLYFEIRTDLKHLSCWFSNSWHGVCHVEWGIIWSPVREYFNCIQTTTPVHKHFNCIQTLHKHFNCIQTSILNRELEISFPLVIDRPPTYVNLGHSKNTASLLCSRLMKNFPKGLKLLRISHVILHSARKWHKTISFTF
jgi:hypothetical protein